MSQVEPSACVDLLIREVGVSKQRAEALVKALADMSAAEALGVMAGTIDAGGSPVDVRVRRLGTIVNALPDSAEGPPPNKYELGAMLRITSTQAANCLRTYIARHPKEYRTRMAPAVKAAAGSAALKQGVEAAVYTVTFTDIGTLEYAADELRKRGFTLGLKVDRSSRSLEVDCGERRQFAGENVTAVDFLKAIDQ